MTKVIITHIAPDFDATAYCWLMRRYAPGFQDARLNFMPLNALDRPALEAADSVGDMGGQYDPANWRFDHHQFQGRASTGTCAAKMTWQQLIVLGQDLQYLQPLIDEIHQGDLARTPVVGIHSLMRGWKITTSEIDLEFPNYAIYCHGTRILDAIAADLEKKAADKLELDRLVVWKSDDALIWAIKGGATGTSFAAYDEGARVVVFEGKPIVLEGAHGAKVTTYPVGATRAPEWTEPDLGALVVDLLSYGEPNLRNELGRWYRHNAGFYAGRGGIKAPDDKPLEVSLKEIAQGFELFWDR